MMDNSMNSAMTMRSGNDATLGRIDQYELIRELGGGGFGTVYLAKDTVSGVDVAVKGLPPFVRNNREELENIRRNFVLVSRLHHPGIAAALVLHPAVNVSYSDKATSEKLRVFEGDTLMVMEYAPGATLSQWRRQFPDNRVPMDQAIAITRQIAEALDYAHERKIIHRDIKPANVMIETSADGAVTARVLDFGLAAEIRSSMGRISMEVHDTSGTRPYMAPEQWSGDRQGPATDQYALAVLFCELITGEVPFASVFECGDPAIMLSTVTTRSFVPLQELPKPVRNALAKALAKKPEERFANCAEFVAALEGRGFSRKERKGGRLLAAAALLVALGGAGYFGWMKYDAMVKAREAEAARIAAERKAEQERIAAEQNAEAARMAEAKAEAERKAKEEADRIARENKKREEDAQLAKDIHLIRAETEAKLTPIGKFNLGQTFDRHVAAANAYWAAAESARKSSDLQTARDYYHKVDEEYQWLASNDPIRAKVIDAMESMSVSVDELKKLNGFLDKAVDVSVFDSQISEAKQSYEGGEFSSALAGCGNVSKEVAKKLSEVKAMLSNEWTSKLRSAIEREDAGEATKCIEVLKEADQSSPLIEKGREMIVSVRKREAEKRAKDEKLSELLNTSKIESFSEILSLIESGAECKITNSSGLPELATKDQPKILEFMLKHGADVNARDSYGKTALMRATDLFTYEKEKPGTRDSNEKVVNLLLDWKPSINCHKSGTFSPLCLARIYDHNDLEKRMLKIMLENGENVNCPQNSDNFDVPLLYVVRLGDVGLMEQFIKAGANVNAIVGKYGKENLIQDVAGRAGSLELLKILVAHGAKTDYLDSYGRTLLMHGAQSGDINIVRYCVEELGQDVNRGYRDRRKFERFPVQEAASRSNCFEIVQYLYSKGANLKTSSGRTLLHDCASSESLDAETLARWLVGLGFSVKAATENGDTPLHCVRTLGVAKVLVDNGAKVDAQNDAGKTPLAGMSYHPEIAEYLISKGANPNLKLKKGGTVFTEGFSTFNATTREYTRVLVRGGADVNARNWQGMPLVVDKASDIYFVDLKFLVEECHADVNATDKDGRSALQKAAFTYDNKNLPVVRFLVEHGAKINYRGGEYGRTPLKWCHDEETRSYMKSKGAVE